MLDAAGRELWRADEAPSTVTDLAWLRDGRRLAVAAYNGVRCHERHQPGPVADYGYPGSHLAVAASPEGRWICTGNQDASIHIWRARDAAELTMSGYPGKVSRLAFDDTGRWLASDGSPEVTVWDFAGKGPKGRAPRMLAAHDTVTALAWRPGNGATLATAGAEGTVALWDATAGRPGRPRTTTTAGWSLEDDIAAITWNGSGTLLAATRGGTVRALDPPATDPPAGRAGLRLPAGGAHAADAGIFTTDPGTGQPPRRVPRSPAGSSAAMPCFEAPQASSSRMA